MSRSSPSPANSLVRLSILSIHPYREARDWARQEIGNFVEVYVKCSLEVCSERDVKGLYKLVKAGQIKNFTGVDDPYEPPLNPELVVDREKETIEESVERILSRLVELEYLSTSFVTGRKGELASAVAGGHA